MCGMIACNEELVSLKLMCISLFWQVENGSEAIFLSMAKMVILHHDLVGYNL